MPSFNSYEDYTQTLKALGCTKVDYELIVRPSKRRAFCKASREQCEKFFEAHNLRFFRMTYRNQFLGYAGPVEQGVWCTWSDALCFGSNLSQAEEHLSASIFCIEMDCRGYANLAPEAVLTGTVDPDVLLRWQAWNAARAFWAEYPERHKA